MFKIEGESRNCKHEVLEPTMTYVRVEKIDHTQVIWLCRPPVNAFNTELYEEFSQLLQASEADPDIRAVILASGLSGIFSAGADIKELRDHPRKSAASNKRHELSFDLWINLMHFTKATIAVIDGYAIGPGLITALCCDVRIASAGASFKMPEFHVGGIGGGAFLRRAGVPEGSVRYMMLSGRTLDGGQALRRHVIDELVTDTDSCYEAALELAQMIAPIKHEVLIKGKQILNEGELLNPDDAVAIERQRIMEMHDETMRTS